MNNTKKFNKICIVCGVTFTTNDENELYCCESCRNIDEKEKELKKSQNNNIINKLTSHKCESCGKKFMSMKIEQRLCKNCS